MNAGSFRLSKLTQLRRRLARTLPTWIRGESDRPALPSPIVAHPNRSGVAIVAIVKDEERYIAEWVAYHLLLGARHVYVYDNGSTDRTNDLLRKGRWSDRITVVPWQNFDTTIRMQNAAYNHALANFGGSYRWMAFIDVDEFIVPKRADTLEAALLSFEHLPVLSLPWHNFGPSGHAARPTGLVIESYVERGAFPPPPDAITLLHYKSIVDPTQVRRAKTHHVELIGEGEVMYNDRGERFAYLDRTDPRHASSDAFQLNHYFTRSQEEMREKIAKGRVSKDGRTTNADFLEEQVRKLQKHMTRDEKILRFAPALKRLMET